MIWLWLVITTGGRAGCCIQQITNQLHQKISWAASGSWTLDTRTQNITDARLLPVLVSSVLLTHWGKKQQWNQYINSSARQNIRQRKEREWIENIFIGQVKNIRYFYHLIIGKLYFEYDLTCRMVSFLRCR